MQFSIIVCLVLRIIHFVAVVVVLDLSCQRSTLAPRALGIVLRAVDRVRREHFLLVLLQTCSYFLLLIGKFIGKFSWQVWGGGRLCVCATEGTEYL